MCGQKRYLLFRQLIQKNYINFDMTYVKYEDYLLKIQNDNKIENPFFELFKKNINLLYDSITLGLLFPKLDDDKYLKGNKRKREMILAIIKIINNCILDLENPEKHNELKIFEILLYLINSKLFFESVDNTYSDATLISIVSDTMENNSSIIKNKIENLKGQNIFAEESICEDLKSLFDNWYENYCGFHSKIMTENSKKKEI